MKTIAKRIGIKVYNLKNGPFWKQVGQSTGNHNGAVPGGNSAAGKVPGVEIGRASCRERV